MIFHSCNLLHISYPPMFTIPICTSVHALHIVADNLEDGKKRLDLLIEPSKNDQEVQEYKSSYWHVLFIPRFISKIEAVLLFAETEHLFTVNKKIQKRRSNLTLGNTAGMTYKVRFGYGANQKETVRKTLAYSEVPSLVEVTKRVENRLKSKFPMCALLRYPDGLHGIKRHRDREIPVGSTIAGLSVGETRTLTISAPKNNIPPLHLQLLPGSLYVFYPPTNERSFHCIEEEPKRTKCRISFTFRTNWT